MTGPPAAEEPAPEAGERWPRGLADAYRAHPRRLWTVTRTRRFRWVLTASIAAGLMLVRSVPPEFRGAAWVAAAAIVAASVWFLRPGLFARWFGRGEGETWRLDHRWSARGAQNANAEMRHLLSLRVVLTHSVGLLILFSMAAGSREAWFWALPFAMLSHWLIRLWRVWGRGCAYVGFTRFPYHPGEPVEIHFGVTPGGPEIQAARFVLRRVQERFDPIVQVPSWRSTFRTRPRANGRAAPGPHADIPLVFDVPFDAGGSRLSAKWPSYWEVEVVATTASRPFVERFLVPIYDRPQHG